MAKFVIPDSLSLDLSGKQVTVEFWYEKCSKQFAIADCIPHIALTPDLAVEIRDAIASYLEEIN